MISILNYNIVTHSICLNKYKEVPYRAFDDEELEGEAVYIAQLHRRALILDRAFKQKVVDSLAQTSTPGPAVVARSPMGTVQQQATAELGGPTFKFTTHTT